MAFLDEYGLTQLWTNILLKLSTKVEKVEGKGLSTNDFTNEEKEKLANLSENGDRKTNAEDIYQDEGEYIIFDCN